MPEFAWGDQVMLGQHVTPYRVIGMTQVNGERALQLASGGDYGSANRITRYYRMRRRPLKDRTRGNLAPYIREVIPVADLVKDGRVWRQRWQQMDLGLDDRVTTKMDPL